MSNGITLDLTEAFKENAMVIIFVGIPWLLAVIGFISFILIRGTIKLLDKYRMRVAVGKVFVMDKNPSSIKEEVRRNLLVYGELAKVSQALSADLVCVFQLHNGGHFNNGKSMLKFSQTHYFADRGHRNFYNRQKFQNQLISLAPDWIGHTIENGKSHTNVHEMSEESEWRREFERSNFECYVQVLVKVGGVEELILSAFLSRPVIAEELEVMCNILQREALVISATLKENLPEVTE